MRIHKHNRGSVRFVVVAVLAVISVGMIAYSAAAVRYRVDGAKTTELRVTELSLTHSVARGPHGKLTNPYATPPAEKKKPAAKKSEAPTSCAFTPTAPKSVSAELAAKKKPASKKPVPKPKAKPTHKPKPKAGAGKACPT